MTVAASTADPPTALLVIGQGISQRCLLETEILDLFLAAGVRVVALVPDPSEPYLQEHVASRGVVLEQIQRKFEGRRVGWRFTAFDYMRKWMVPGHRSTAFRNRLARKHRKLDAANRRRFFNFLNWVTRTILWRSRAARRFVFRIDQQLNVQEGHAELFDRYRPSLAVAGTLGHLRWDGIVLREAQQRGVPVAVPLVSWDNVSSKEYRMYDPDAAIAWSDEMARQLTDFQDVDPERIHVTGAYHWDRYVRPGALIDRDELFTQLGLDPSRRLILFTAPPPKSYVAAGRMAGAIAHALESGALPDAQLVVRLHPNAFLKSGRNPVVEHVREVAAAHDNTSISSPEIVSESVGGAVSRHDSIVLASLLKHADVCINLFSTTTLEAFLVDTPVVLVNDDVGLTEDELAAANVHRYDTFAHLATIQRGTGPVAHSIEDVIERTREYLADPSLHRAERAEIARQECGPMDGYAARRAGRRLLELMGVPAEEVEAAVASLGDMGTNRPVERSGEAGGVRV